MGKTTAFKTKSKNKSLVFAPTDEHYKAELWVFRQGYKIYPVPLEADLYKIAVKLGKTEKIGSKTYSKREAEDKIWEIYIELYKKRRI